MDQSLRKPIIFFVMCIAIDQECEEKPPICSCICKYLKPMNILIS